MGVQTDDPCPTLECTSPTGLSDSPKSSTTNEIPSSDKSSSASILSGKHANLTWSETVHEKPMLKSGGNMPGIVKLNNETYLIPIPGKQMQMGELTASEKLGVRYIQSASGKLLPAHIINTQSQTGASKSVSLSSSPSSVQSPSSRSESPKQKVIIGKRGRSKGSTLEQCSKQSENESDEGDDDEQKDNDDAEKFVIVKTEPVEYSEYDSDEKQSFLNPGLQISNTVSGAEASAHFEYVIKPEPPDDF